MVVNDVERDRQTLRRELHSPTAAAMPVHHMNSAEQIDKRRHIPNFAIQEIARLASVRSL